MLNINCLGKSFKLGMIYNHCSNEVINDKDALSKLKKFATMKTKKQTTEHYMVSSLYPICNDTLYSRCGIDKNLQLGILTGLVKPCGASAAFIEHLSNTMSIALHFKCITKVEKWHPNRPNKATHVVGEVRYGVDAIFIIDQHFESEVDIAERIKKAFDSGSFEEIECISGKLFIDEGVHVALSSNVTTIKDMKLFCNQVEEMLQSACTSPFIIPIEVKLFPLKPMNKIDSVISNEITHIIQHLNRNSIECAKIFKMLHFITDGMNTKYQVINKLVIDYTEKFKKEIHNLIPKVREGTVDAQALKAICENHFKSPFNEELDKMMATMLKEVDAMEKYISQIGKGKHTNDIILNYLIFYLHV